MANSLDHQILLEMMLQISRKSEEIANWKGKQVVEEFVSLLRPFYQDQYPEAK